MLYLKVKGYDLITGEEYKVTSSITRYDMNVTTIRTLIFFNCDIPAGVIYGLLVPLFQFHNDLEEF